MANIEKINFDKMVFSKLIKNYLQSANNEDIAPNKNFAYIESLGLFERNFLNRLDEEHRAQLVDVFNKCVKQQNFRPFVEIAEREIPNVAQRDFSGFDRASKAIMRQGMSENVYLDNEDFDYTILVDKLQGSLFNEIINFVDNRKNGIQSIRALNSKNGKGLSGVQFLSLLSGAYYLKDYYEAKRTSFGRFKHYQKLFNKDNAQKILSEVGLNYDAIKDSISENSVFEEDRVRGKDMTYAQYDFSDIAIIDREQRKLTSLLVKDLVKREISLPTSKNFKAWNELNRVQRKELENLIALNPGDKYSKTMDRLGAFGAIVEKSASEFYQKFGTTLKTDISVESIANDLIEELAENGAFASKTTEEFEKIATFVSAQDKFKNYYLDPEMSEISQLGTKEGDQRVYTTAYVRHEDQTYVLDSIVVPNGDLNAFVESLKPSVVMVEGKPVEQVSAEFLKIKDALKARYNKSFDSLQLDEVIVGNSMISNEFYTLKAKEQIVQNQVKLEKLNSANIANVSATQKREQINPIVEDFIKKVAPVQPKICTANYIYEEAYNEAMKNISQMMFANPELFRNKYSLKKEQQIEKDVVKTEMTKADFDEIMKDVTSEVREEDEKQEETKTEEIAKPGVKPDDIVKSDEIEKAVDNSKTEEVVATQNLPDELRVISHNVVEKRKEAYEKNFINLNTYMVNLNSLKDTIMISKALDEVQKQSYAKRIDNLMSGTVDFETGLRKIKCASSLDEITMLSENFGNSLTVQEGYMSDISNDYASTVKQSGVKSPKAKKTKKTIKETLKKEDTQKEVAEEVKEKTDKELDLSKEKVEKAGEIVDILKAIKDKKIEEEQLDTQFAQAPNQEELDEVDTTNMNNDQENVELGDIKPLDVVEPVDATNMEIKIEEPKEEKVVAPKANEPAPVEVVSEKETKVVEPTLSLDEIKEMVEDALSKLGTSIADLNSTDKHFKSTATDYYKSISREVERFFEKGDPQSATEYAKDIVGRCEKFAGQILDTNKKKVRLNKKIEKENNQTVAVTREKLDDGKTMQYYLNKKGNLVRSVLVDEKQKSQEKSVYDEQGNVVKTASKKPAKERELSDEGRGMGEE